MLLVPDAASAFVDPFTTVPTLDIICNVKDPVTLQPYSRDPRYIALKSTGIGGLFLGLKRSSLCWMTSGLISPTTTAITT
jgi:hypothetical protein